MRRKQASECWSGEETEKGIFRHFCECTDMDYECDFGYLRTEDGRCTIDLDQKIVRNTYGMTED